MRGVPSCSLGFEVDKCESAREGLAEVALGVVGAAEVRAGDVAPAHDELAALEPFALAGVEAWRVRRAVRRQQQAAARTKHPPELIAPRQLKLVGEVCEDRQRVDEVEALVVERERWFKPVELEAEGARGNPTQDLVLLRKE